MIQRIGDFGGYFIFLPVGGAFDCLIAHVVDGKQGFFVVHEHVQARFSIEVVRLKVPREAHALPAVVLCLECLRHHRKILRAGDLRLDATAELSAALGRTVDGDVVVLRTGLHQEPPVRRTREKR